MKIKTPPKGAIFNQVKVKTPPKSAHDMSFENKLTLNMGKLYPILCNEVLPGEKFTIDTSALVRFHPLIAPLMHKVDVYIHYFFVPNRLVWSNWEKFISPANGEEVMSSINVYTPPKKPQLSTDYLANMGAYDKYAKNILFGAKSLSDYLGINIHDSSFSYDDMEELNNPVIDSIKYSFIDELPFRAYHLICDTYYRNTALEEPWLPENFADYDGEDLATNSWDYGNLFLLRTRSWQKDYFTSCLPSPQMGNPVILDGGEVNLSDDTLALTVPNSVAPGSFIRVSSVTDNSTQETYLGATLDNTNVTSGAPTVKARFKIEKADGTDFIVPSTAISINALREANALQEFLELQGRAGTRYSESIRAHWGVIPSDSRLQRPEYLGGGKQAVSVSAVEQQSATTDNSPLGNLAGQAISVGNDFSCQYGEAEEHGFVIGIMSVMPSTAYQQGIPRMFTRQDTFDYAFPAFANLGEQEIKQKEVFFKLVDSYVNKNNGTVYKSGNDNTFGYLPRYSEYKYNSDQVHGDFKNSLNFWHMGRIFQNAPTLNVKFTDCDPTKRIFAVQDEEEDALQAYLWHDFRSIKPLPKWGTPKLI